MNIGKDVMTLLGGAVALIVLLTVISGANIGLGTSSSGPFLQFGYKGPKAA